MVDQTKEHLIRALPPCGALTTVLLCAITMMQKCNCYRCDSSNYLSICWKNQTRPTSCVGFFLGWFPLGLSPFLHYLRWETDGKAFYTKTGSSLISLIRPVLLLSLTANNKSSRSSHINETKTFDMLTNQVIMNYKTFSLSLRFIYIYIYIRSGSISNTLFVAKISIILLYFPSTHLYIRP